MTLSAESYKRANILISSPISRFPLLHPQAASTSRVSCRFHDNPRTKDVATRLLIHELLGNHLPDDRRGEQEKWSESFLSLCSSIWGPSDH
jgi:hypothetical protein